MNTFLICQLFIWCSIVSEIDLGPAGFQDNGSTEISGWGQTTDASGNQIIIGSSGLVPGKFGNYQIEFIGTIGFDIFFDPDPDHNRWAVIRGLYNEWPADLSLDTTLHDFDSGDGWTAVPRPIDDPDNFSGYDYTLFVVNSPPDNFPNTNVFDDGVDYDAILSFDDVVDRKLLRKGLRKLLRQTLR